MEKLKERIVDEYLKYFNGLVKFSKMELYSQEFNNITYIKFFLAKDISELDYNCWENDMFNINFKLKVVDNILILENISKSYFIKPRDIYLYFSPQKISFRKIKGNEDKIISSLSKFFERLYISVLKDRENGELHETFNKSFKNINFRNPLYNKIRNGEI